ncbi:hypothetical protein [Actinomadura opuntiae]|uniref:hypothetical protein n=1 Tax=Actinomadura sp. OS1-43 TaxID=604315 RepID=UPI00255AEF9C|nr:hypothetical protein [Actinomadura sp. OS1-43]MDL4819916.1 hypothetical protein [Actinomadura sp. OS1-43]
MTAADPRGTALPGPPAAPARRAGGGPAASDTAGQDAPDADPPDTAAAAPAPRPRPGLDGAEPAPDAADPHTAARADGPPDVRALVRAQLRIALETAAIVLAVAAAVPALPVLAPGLGRIRPFGVPLSWLLPVLVVQPLWMLAALRHLRRAERAERDLTRPAGRR